MKEQKHATTGEPDLLRAIRALGELDAYQYRRLHELCKRDIIIACLSLRAAKLETALEAASARIQELEGELPCKIDSLT
jgi:hypothetical protein